MHPTRKGADPSYSPTFNSYFNTDLADIAARVTTEFPDAADEFAVTRDDLEDEVDTAVDDFEFDLSNLTPEDGEIRPVYPVFNRDLLWDFEMEPRPSVPEEENSSKPQIQLKSLFLADRDHIGADLDPPSSSSSSEAGDLEEILPEAYRVWAESEAPAASPSPGRCTKSNSTGSSVTVAGKAKAWRLKDFLKRSKSDGKEGLMVLAPKKKKEEAEASDAAKLRSARVRAAREGYYGGGTGRSHKGGETKRKSYLPYRQDLVGLFATPHAFRKVRLPPF